VRAVTAALALGVWVALACAPARAENWAPAGGEPPIDVRPAAPIVAEPGEALVVRGEVLGEAPAGLVLRVEDGHSTGYPSRVNEERLFPPGPFAWRYPLSGQKTSNGYRVLDARDIRRLMLFEPNRTGRVKIDTFAVEPAAKLPEGAVGYSLGAADAPLIGGLVRMTPDDPRIAGRHPVAVRRPSPDPVIANGIVDVERLRLAWPQGHARVSLWLEDPGEWETLPHPLQRRVRVNGQDVVYDQLTPQQWIDRRYLAGRDREADAGDDAWTAFGRARGGLVSTDVDVGSDGVEIELAGDGAASTFLSAVVIEPAGRTSALEAVQAARRQWMIETFPVMPTRSAEPAPVFDGAGSGAPLRVAVAPGTGVRVAFAVGGPGVHGRPAVSIRTPELGGDTLNLDLYAAQRRLDRTGADSNLLVRTDRLLRGDPGSLAISAAEPRRYVAWASAPKDAKPGLYRGAITLDAGKTVAVPIEVEVLPVDLPEPASPAGFYLEEAPHLTWFAATRADRGRQLGCDLATLARFGVLGDAPGLAPPNREGLATFLDDTRRADTAGVASPWLAYQAFTRMLWGEGGDAAAEDLKTAMAALKAAGLPAPVWGLFDEPSNFGGGAVAAAATSARLHAISPEVRLGGQFNNPADRKYLDVVDVAIVNPGFGIDVGTIAQLEASGREAWLYNTGAPRFTAGVWLWRTGASRYVQWHARMPTADPYDPTDGREGDVQVFPPMPEVCALNQDIDDALIEMAEGLVDQRWLQWLAGRPEPQAKALLAGIVRDMPVDWASASSDGAARAGSIRDSIMSLARRLK